MTWLGENNNVWDRFQAFFLKLGEFSVEFNKPKNVEHFVNMSDACAKILDVLRRDTAPEGADAIMANLSNIIPTQLDEIERKKGDSKSIRYGILTRSVIKMLSDFIAEYQMALRFKFYVDENTKLKKQINLLKAEMRGKEQEIYKNEATNQAETGAGPSNLQRATPTSMENLLLEFNKHNEKIASAKIVLSAEAMEAGINGLKVISHKRSAFDFFKSAAYRAPRRLIGGGLLISWGLAVTASDGLTKVVGKKFDRLTHAEDSGLDFQTALGCALILLGLLSTIAALVKGREVGALPEEKRPLILKRRR